MRSHPSVQPRHTSEGIERQAELDMLRELGVHLGQGYLLGRPQPVACADQVLGAGWAWSEDDARRLVEEAGFAEVFDVVRVDPWRQPRREPSR